MITIERERGKKVPPSAMFTRHEEEGKQKKKKFGRGKTSGPGAMHKQSKLKRVKKGRRKKEGERNTKERRERDLPGVAF